MSKTVVTTTVEVEIYGSTYKVRGGNDSRDLQELASLVDEKMREIATQTATVDTTKIAILAALNFADELCASRSGNAGEQDDVAEKVADLAGQLESALEG